MVQTRSKQRRQPTQKSLSQTQFARAAAETAGPDLGVTNEALQAALDVGHLLQHVVHAGFIELQTDELRVLTKKDGDGLDLERLSVLSFQGHVS